MQIGLPHCSQRPAEFADFELQNWPSVSWNFIMKWQQKTLMIAQQGFCFMNSNHMVRVVPLSDLCLLPVEEVVDRLKCSSDRRLWNAQTGRACGFADRCDGLGIRSSRREAFLSDCLELVCSEHTGLVQKQVFLRNTLTEDHKVISVDRHPHAVVDQNPDRMMNDVADDTECNVAAWTDIQTNAVKP
jgi:hypothetical protein